MAKKAKKISPIKNSKKQKSRSKPRSPQIENALNRMWDTTEDIQDIVLSDEIAVLTAADIAFINTGLEIAKVFVSGVITIATVREKKTRRSEHR